MKIEFAWTEEEQKAGMSQAQIQAAMFAAVATEYRRLNKDRGADRDLSARETEEACCLAILSSISDTTKLNEIFCKICVLKDNWWRSGDKGGEWFISGHGAEIFRYETNRRLGLRKALPSRRLLEASIQFLPTVTDYNRLLGSVGLSLLHLDESAINGISNETRMVFVTEASKCHDRLCKIFEKEIQELFDQHHLKPMSVAGQETIQHEIRRKIKCNIEVEKEMRIMFNEIERRWREEV